MDIKSFSHDGATVINTIYQDGGAYTTQKKLIQCLQLIVSGHIVSRYLDINLRAYDFMSQELKAAEDPEFENSFK